ncbi:metal-dependent hydrolase [Vibrio sp. SCSIO 43140]|uniref:metal-dependent hydrolase n=1 Tax=Vibrio sp. SCSIO 43140 TaxID=2819100 RepID=UPI002074AF6D|nr:metal-dependent hydrolase [Vibrio sp. SCSIO 43140]USD63434.1 metal-dependent hydrolase [Vibrio sp. SCSIO 43140]
MDSVTQAALGATVAGAIAGKRCNAKVLLTGAALGTLPDLDVVIDYGDAVSNTIKHRGFTHSLLLIPIFSLFVSWLYCRFRSDAFWSFKRVFALVLSVLVTHVAIDAMTTYGTQLLWPLPGYFEVGNVFIIDPLYTIPLLIGIVVALFSKRVGGRWCQGVVLVSSLYLLWGFAAQQVIADRVEENLAAQNISNDQVLITPSPFNTLLWRVVVVEGDQYFEGLASLLDSDSQIDFIQRSRGEWPLESKPQTLIGLEAFSHGFLGYRQDGEKLIVSDLRLGMADSLAFEFVFAKATADSKWQLLEAPTRYPSERSLDQISVLWERMLGDQGIDANLHRMAYNKAREHQE